MNLKNKKVLVTGAGGFIGSHLVERLVEIGAKVKAFVRYNSNNNWGWLEKSKYKDEIEIYRGDIREYDSVRDAMKGVDVVFHLAALIGIPYSYVSPLAYIKTNIEGTYNVLQSARELDIERVIHTSTSEVYGTARYIPIDELHPLQPQSPYSATKISADNMALSFYNSFDLPVTIVRPFNTYGPRQSARAVIPTIITQILTGKKQINLGNLSPTRDLNFVKDTVNGFIKIAECDELIGNVTNIGSGNEISIGALADMIAKLMGVDIEIVQEKQRLRPNKSEVERLICNNDKIKKYTDWNPGYSLEDGLKETIEWIRANISLYKPEAYNV
ncbi:dTDP-glucose 4,6-dehydratase [Thermoanaerobacterium xylanolyticum LX-11]|uniref:dTDP-glucose 4,6-dehydratase n=1 Tax=Thermoanaerobacterium xylanolyticum (strain ATCC 49914 / DSM 7097 / LX-11) TaxID=858215 RepID=F6BJ83_THEXL|nr:NAD-dependent 4,6-dehydratase LegB [Thermoanaerobacterium xylanolyticum]AEF17900.1 dTDP-glucose 4,6-dehydratase [Thermoanaerobacterium xylanolyticum LX-11]